MTSHLKRAKIPTRLGTAVAANLVALSRWNSLGSLRSDAAIHFLNFAFLILN
jgi:hypothetical protein